MVLLRLRVSSRVVSEKALSSEICERSVDSWERAKSASRESVDSWERANSAAADDGRLVLGSYEFLFVGAGVLESYAIQREANMKA